MGRGHFRDAEWRGTLLLTTTAFVAAFYVLDIPCYIVNNIMFGSASNTPIEELPPDFAWYLRGNLSLLSPAVYNRTDTDASSPTHGLWTPPPGPRGSR